jgi:Pentapeptide repeats (8 copies)
LWGAKFECIILPSGISKQCASLQGASLVGARLEGASLVGAQLQGAWFNYAQLQGASLDEAQLCRTDARGSAWEDTRVIEPQIEPMSAESFAELKEMIGKQVCHEKDRET